MTHCRPGRPGRIEGLPGITPQAFRVDAFAVAAAPRACFEGLDLGGIYKKWQRFQPEAMGAARRAHGLRRKVPPRTPD